MVVKHKNTSLDVYVEKSLTNLSVSMTIPYACSHQCIDLLLSRNPCEGDANMALHAGAEEACLAFSLFASLKDKMFTPKDIAKNKVDHIVCRSHGDSFVISWNTQGSKTALRKTIGIALSCCKPHTLSKYYKNYIRLLGTKPANQEVFIWAANKMIDALKSIHFVAIGRLSGVNDKKKDMQELLETAHNKFVSSEKVSGQKAPDKHPEHPANYVDIKCKDGAAAIITASYIQQSGIPVKNCGKHVFIYSKSWDGKRNVLKDKSRISNYVSQKYKSKQSALYLAYASNSSAMGTGSAVMGLISQDIEKVLKENI